MAIVDALPQLCFGYHPFIREWTGWLSYRTKLHQRLGGRIDGHTLNAAHR